MSRERKRYDYVIVGGGSAGSALANRLSADPGASVLVLEAGHADTRLDPLVNMPAALPFPIGNRLYDWKYQTDPEPHMHNRRIYHARGKVLGGSSSINGMIFQRGNPMDFERWAADPGLETWDYLHCLPYFKRMETRLDDAGRPGRGRLARRRRPAAARARSGHQPAVRGVLRGRAAGRLPADRRRQRLPAGGLRPVRPQHLPEPPLVRRPGLPRPGAVPPQPAHRDPRLRHRRAVPGQARGRRRLPARRPPAQRRCGRGRALRRRDQHPAAPPAVRSRRRHAPRAAGRRDGPRPQGRGRQPAGPPRGLRPVRLEGARLDRTTA